MVNLGVGRSFGPLLLLGVFATLVQTAHGAAAICPGPDPCVLEQSTGCSEFLEIFDVSGTCCSLSQSSTTGNCIVTISNGYCEIYSTVEGPNGCPPGCECNEETNEMSCVIPGTQWTSESDQPCPESEWVPPDGSVYPSDYPSLAPSGGPTVGPTIGPTVGPTVGPTEGPTVGPTVGPTEGPTVGPSEGPTVGPTTGSTDSSEVDLLNAISESAQIDEAFSMKPSKIRGKRPDADSGELAISESAEIDEAKKGSKNGGKRPDADSSEVDMLNTVSAEIDQSFSMKASKIRKKKTTKG